MKWKIEVSYKTDSLDALAQGLSEDIIDLGITEVNSVRTGQLYWIEGDLNTHEIERICSELLTDSITQKFVYHDAEHLAQETTSPDGACIVEVQFKPGVTDTVGDSVLKGISDLGISGLETAKTGKKYWFHDNLSSRTMQTITQRLLVNEVIETFEISVETE